MNNPGKTLGELLGGLALLAIGIIIVTMNTTVRFSLCSVMICGINLSSGLLVIPLLISIVMLIAMENRLPGWIVFWLSMGSILVSLILSLRLSFNTTSLFNMILMFLPIVIGLGLVIKGSFDTGKKD